MATKSRSTAKPAPRRPTKAPAKKQVRSEASKTAKPRKPAARPTPSTTASTTRADSKQTQLIAALQKRSGCSLAEMTALTGWQPHSVRGVMSGVLRKKLGLNLVSAKDGDERRWRIEAVPAR